MRQLSLGGEEATAPRAVGLTTHPERASKQNTDLLGVGRRVAEAGRQRQEPEWVGVHLRMGHEVRMSLTKQPPAGSHVHAWI